MTITWQDFLGAFGMHELETAAAKVVNGCAACGGTGRGLDGAVVCHRCGGRMDFTAAEWAALVRYGWTAGGRLRPDFRERAQKHLDRGRSS